MSAPEKETAGRALTRCSFSDEVAMTKASTGTITMSTTRIGLRLEQKAGYLGKNTARNEYKGSRL
jgi:hypothetical protein